MNMIMSHYYLYSCLQCYQYNFCLALVGKDKVSGLKFVTREDADSLVVSANTQSGGVVEVWQLTERAVPLHRVFQPPNELFKTVVSITV